MKDIVLESGEYTNYKYFAPEVGKIIDGKSTGHGNDGKVIRYNKGNVLKLWHDDINPVGKEEYIVNLQEMLDANCKYNHIFTPKGFVYFNNEIVGFVMRYFEGRRLKDISSLTSMRALLIGLVALEKEVYNFSIKGFKLKDIHPKNLMLNQKHKMLSFGLIDPDPWERHEDESFEQIYSYNINAIRNIIFDALLTDEIKDFINQDTKLSETFKVMEEIKEIIAQSEDRGIDCYLPDDKYNVELSTFLKQVKKSMEQETAGKVRTLGDFQNRLR